MTVSQNYWYSITHRLSIGTHNLKRTVHIVTLYITHESAALAFTKPSSSVALSIVLIELHRFHCDYYCSHVCHYTIRIHAAGCNAEGSECRYRFESLKANTPYAILVVSGNSATDDPECLFNVTVLGSRYLVMVVGTEDAVDGELGTCNKWIAVHF